MEGNCTLVPGGSTAPNLLELLNAEKERCVVVCPIGSGLFDYSEPSLTPSSHGEQGVDCNCIEFPRPFSNCFSAEIGRCVGVFHMGFIAEKARCVEVFDMSLTYNG